MRFARIPLLFALAALASCAKDDRSPAPILAFDHVAVIDVRVGAVVEDQRVVVSGNRIMAVGKASETDMPRGAQVVDGRGQFLIPGLWDMHTHVIDPDSPGGPAISLPLFVANGITGIRDVGSSSLDSIVALRGAIRGGDRVGPRMLISGKLIDGLPVVFPPDAIVARTADEATAAVDSLAARGVDVIKGYEMLSRDAFLALVARARLRRLPIAAHVPLVIDAREASELGVHSFEHLRNIEFACSSMADSLRQARTERLDREAGREHSGGLAFDWSLGYGPGAKVRASIHAEQRHRAIATYDASRCNSLLAALAQNGTWQTPTLFVSEKLDLRVDTMSSVRAVQRYVPASTWKLWADGTSRAAEMTPKAREEMREQGRWYFKAVRDMQAASIGLLAGTDVSTPYAVPGFSLHEELALLVQAGLTPLEALRTATLNPASYLAGADSLGTVESGRLADLVLLAANPLDDIKNSRRINGVVLNGRYFDRAALDALLANAERAANPSS